MPVKHQKQKMYSRKLQKLISDFGVNFTIIGEMALRERHNVFLKKIVMT